MSLHCPLNTTTIFSSFEPLDNAEYLTPSRNHRLSPQRTKSHNQPRPSIHPGSVHGTNHSSRERSSTITVYSCRVQATEADRGFVICPLSYILRSSGINSDCLDENIDPTAISTAFSWILPYLSTASPAFCTPPRLVSPSWSFHDSHRFKQPLCLLMSAYLIVHCTHVFRLRAPVHRVMTLRTFNSSARSGSRKPPGSFVTRQRRGTILSEEPLCSRHSSAYIHSSAKDPPWNV